MQRANGVHHTGKGSMDATGDIGDGAAGKFDALCFAWCRDPHEFAHASQPIYVVGAIKAIVISGCLDSHPPVLKIKHAVRHNTVGFDPRLRRAAEQWQEELADEALPLLGPLAVIVHDPTIIKEHRELRHRYYPLKARFFA